MPTPKNKQETEWFSNLFHSAENSWKESEPAWMKQKRQEAIHSFLETGFPTQKDEAWKSTPLHSLSEIPYKIEQTKNRPLPLDLSLPEFGEETRLAFVNGIFSSALSFLGNLPPQATIMSRSEALKISPSLLSSLDNSEKEKDNPFSDLNEAFAEDGAFLYFEKGVRLKKPVHLLFLQNPLAHEPIMASPRNIIWVGEDCEITLVESYNSLNEGPSLTNTKTMLHIGANSIVHHYKMQKENEESVHMASSRATVDRSGRLQSHPLSLGSSIMRDNVTIQLNGEGADVALNGLFMARNKQHMDHYIRVKHAKPHGTSNQLFKGILDDQAKGVFHGMVEVHTGAVKTKAHQHIRNILLSDKAEVLPEPQLKILNNDVQCTHGATVGQLDKNALFYLCSRGIGIPAARNLLTYAFAAQVLDQIKEEAIRIKAIESILQRLPETGIQRDYPCIHW